MFVIVILFQHNINFYLNNSASIIDRNPSCRIWQHANEAFVSSQESCFWKSLGNTM